MIPKLNWRRIGSVNIFELEGIFSEPWLQRSKQEITDVLTQCPSEGLLFNLRSLERVDHPGAQVILDTARSARKGGILGQNLSSYFVAEHMKSNETVPIFGTESEAIEYFGREMAKGGKSTLRKGERRLFKRIKTAFPVELKWQGEGNLTYFEAVVLNLSEGGLYGRFINSKSEALAKRVLDPFDLKMLSLKLTLPSRLLVETKGKVLRTEQGRSEPGTVAIAFYNLGLIERQKINAFLEQASAE